jgi:hypothetical protein
MLLNNMTAKNFLKKHVLLWTMLLGLTPVLRAEVIARDSFEAASLANWKITKSDTDTDVSITAPGHLSAPALEINKHDMSGLVSISRDFDVPAGHFVRLCAGIQSEFVGPYSEYFLQVAQLDGAGKTIEQKSLSFEDGVSVSSVFGGAYKTPQTLGEWKTTRHLIKLEAKTVKLRVAFVFRAGQQRVRLDDFQIEDLGTQEPPPLNLPFYEKSLDSAAALLNLDMLTPGFAYEVTATTSTPDREGMDIVMAWKDRKGNVSEKQPLWPLRSEGPELVYRVDVPERAVEVQLDLRNSDLTTLGWGQENKYRRWNTITIRTLAMPLAQDTLFYNYTRNISKHPELTKPREMVEVSDYDRMVLNAHLARRAIEGAAVKKINGGMAIQLGNQVVPPIINASLATQSRYDVYSELAKQGLNLIRVDDPNGGPPMSGMWTAPGQYDFSGVDDTIYRALKQNPEARIIYMISGLFPPAWWGEAHPAEIMRDAQGLALATEDKPFLYRRRWGRMEDAKFRDYVRRKNGSYYPSPASQPYRAAMKEYISALRRYIEAQPYGKAVVGYNLAWGYDMQWGWPVSGSNADEIVGEGKTPPHVVDYSSPMLAYFRDFLRQKYQTEAALQAAWKNPQTTFATAELPTVAQRDPSELPDAKPPYTYFLDPATQQQVLDFNTAYAEIVGDLLADMGQAVKAAAPRSVLVTAYFQDITRDLGLSKVLAEPGLDISGGPLYDAREVGQSGLSPHLHSSYSLHDKIEFTEVDHRVFSTISRNYRGNQVFETPRKSISILQREFARQMVNGGGAWTLDMGLGWFTQPIIAATLGDIHAVFQKVLQADRSSSAKMALFIGEYSWRVRQSPRFGIRPYYLAKYIRSSLAQSGVSADVYQLADLPRVAANYKVFLFPFAYALSEADRSNIEALKKNGNLLVFGPAAGYAADNSLALENVTSLTGMQMQQDDSLPFTIRVTNAKNPITQEVRGFIGSDESDHQFLKFPMFAVTDPKAVSLAEYVDKGKGKTGLAFKDHGEWQSVYLGAMGYYPPELFRGLARQAGIHIYAGDGDVLFANKSLIAVHAASDGDKTLELPAPAHVISLWDNQDLGVVKTIRRPMRTGDNALYMLEAK